MRSLSCALALATAVASCRAQSGSDSDPFESAPRVTSAQLPRSPSRAPSAASVASVASVASALPADAALEVQRDLQARLRPAPRRDNAPRLAFARGVVAQLTSDAVRVYSALDGSLVLAASLDLPRAVVALADGALLGVGGRAMVRIDGKKVTSLSKPVFLPGADLFADAIAPDRIWIARGRLSSAPPSLSSYVLAPGSDGVMLPEQVLDLDAPSGGSFGLTREGVWLYFTGERIDRFAPAGARLGRLAAPGLKGSFFALPTRRLDQEYLLDDDGHLTRALVTPLFRRLSEAELGVAPLAACVANGARVLAVLALVGVGPRFELRLFDEKLLPMGSVPLSAPGPTGREDWVQVVTRNLELACDPHQDRIAVGGPDQVQILDGRGQLTLSIPSR
jgi:hypothetical protein